MDKRIKLLLATLWPIFSFAYSGYVGDYVDLQVSVSSSEIYSIDWKKWSGDIDNVTLITNWGNDASVRIDSYFTGSVRIRAQYKTTRNAIKTEYFDITCDPVTLSPNPSSISMNVGDKEYITYNISPYGKWPTVSYSSNNSDVASVDSYGKVTAVAKGYATITLSNSMGPDATVGVSVDGGSSPDSNPNPDPTPNPNPTIKAGDWIQDYTEEGQLMMFYVVEDFYTKELFCMCSGTSNGSCISSANGKVTIPSKAKGLIVRSISNAAFSLRGLTDLVIPATVQYVQNYICGSGCEDLKTITCLATTPPTGATDICSLASLKELYVPKGCLNLYKAAEGWKTFGTITEIGGASTNDDIININSENFPDDNFRKCLLEEDFGKDGIIKPEEIVKIWFLNIESKNIKNIKGIEIFKELEYLICRDNQISSLDINENKKLLKVDCGHNNLTSINVSNNTALEYIICGDNQLLSLDVSQCTVLQELTCVNNKLESLLLPNSSNLSVVSCSGNQIKGVNMDNLINSLPYNYTNNKHKFFVDNGYESEGNILTTQQAASAKAKGWIPYRYNDTSYNWVEYFGSPNGIEINSTNFPDDNFRQYINEMFGNDGVLSDDEIKYTTLLDVQSREISSLTGVEYFTELEYLYCGYNIISSLNISNNQKLTDLQCQNNSIDDLDLSKNVLLESLACSHNKLTKLDVSRNTALTGIWCNHNKIKGKATDDLINSLPTNNTNEVYHFVICRPVEVGEDNECTKAQVAAAKMKGWQPQYYYDGTWNDYEGVDGSSSIFKIEVDNKERKPIYNLFGQKVQEPQKGVVIYNGKKHIVK